MMSYTFQNGETHDVLPDGSISFHITVDLDDVITHDKTWLNEKVSVQATGTKLMRDIEFCIIMGDGPELTLQVIGNVSDIINNQARQEGKDCSC